MDLYSTVQRIRRTRSSYRGRGQGNPIAGLLYNVMTGRKMMRLVSNEARGYSYLVDAAATVGAAPRITWHYGRFLEALIGACEAITTCPPSAKKQNQELENALKRKDEIEAKVPRLVDFISDGFSAGAHGMRAVLLCRQQRATRLSKQKRDESKHASPTSGDPGEAIVFDSVRYVPALAACPHAGIKLKVAL